MENESVFTPEIKEIEKIKRAIIRICDDKKHITKPLKRTIEKLGERIGLNITNVNIYDKGELMIEKIREIIENREEQNEEFPNMIIVDYDLKKDNPDYKTGDRIIKKTNKMCKENDMKLPIFVANSSEFSGELLEAGATYNLKKEVGFEMVEKMLRSLIEIENNK